VQPRRSMSPMVSILLHFTRNWWREPDPALAMSHSSFSVYTHDGWFSIVDEMNDCEETGCCVRILGPAQD
jgi:hypothetical protein